MCLLIAVLVAMAIRRVVDNVSEAYVWCWALLQREGEETRSGVEGSHSACSCDDPVKDDAKERGVESPVETFWRDLADHPEDWWDNWATRRNPKAPDFKHRVTRQPLWTPVWAHRYFQGVL